MPDMMALPEYRSIKTVWALKIARVEDLGTDSTTDENPLAQIYFEDERYASQFVNLRGKPTPDTGWYWVRYEDGYESFSPGPQFEKGNILKRALVEKAARTAHEANRVLNQVLGDDMASWEDSPESQRQSVINGVYQILNNPTTTPKSSHAEWLRYKGAEGWKYGPTKNQEAKEHPCFMPYEDLPPQQRMKDHMFSLVVRSVLFV